MIFNSLDTFRKFPSAGVPNDWKTKSLFSCKVKSIDDLRSIVHGGDKVYVVCAFFLKLKKNLRKAFDRNEFSRFAAAYLSVLAKNAAHCASGKENRSGTFFAGNARFFPKMKGGPCYFNFFSAAAKSVFSGKTVGTAFSWAKLAFFGKFQNFRRLSFNRYT